MKQGQPLMASEDFAFMLQHQPHGGYVIIV